MKLTVFLMLVSLMGVWASDSYSQNTKLSMNVSQMRLEDFLKKIEEKSDFRFFYSGKIDVDQKVSGSFEKEPISQILEEVLQETGIQFEVMGRQIILSPGNTKSEAVAEQPRPLTGTIKSAGGEPLPGVTILVKGTTVGTITDANGRFTLANVPQNSTLVVSFVGMKSQEVVVGTQTVINVVLEEESIGLEEVVAVGYGTQKRETLSGSISSIKSKEILTTKTTSLVSNLQGKIPGVLIRQQTGEPGTFNSMVSIRGFGSPIVVIDGVARDGMSDFERLNPEDVESISILKDASAAIYGMNADNGVIIVTTKKGEKGKTKFNYSAFYGVKQATGMETTVDAYTYRLMRNEMEKNIGNPIMFSAAELDKWKTGTEPGYVTWDWIDLTLKKFTNQQQHNFSLNGGNEKISYYTSLAYTEDNGLLKSNIQKYRKYNFRNTMTAQLTKDFSAKVTVSGKFDKNRSPQGSYFWAFKPILTVDRGVGPFSISNPNHLTAPPPEQNNPVALTYEKYSGYDKWTNLQYQTTLELSYAAPFLKGLTLSLLGAYDGNINNWSNLALGWYRYDYLTDAMIGTGQNRLTTYSNAITIFNRKDFQAQATYKNSFNKVHNIGATLVFEAKAIENHTISAKRQYDDVYTHDIIDQGSQTNQTTGGNRYYQRYLSYIGRFNYDYTGKYLFEAAFRYDGSYRYAPAKRWVLFPSLSAGWRISEEPFIKNNLPVISNLKLRGSIGWMGADQGNAFEYIGGYKLSGIDGGYVFNDGTLTTGMVPIGITNENLTWIKTRTMNIGVDAEFWKGKLGVTADVFQKNRDGLLGTRIQSVPNTFGASFPQESINSDLYKGIELIVSHKNTKGDFTYGVSVNATYARKYLVHTERAPYASTWEAWKDAWGSERYLGREWAYKYDGIYNNLTEYETAPLLGGSSGNARMLPGSTRVTDVNGDGVINSNDMLPFMWAGQYQGYAGNPPLQFGANLNASWRNFDMNMLLQGAALFTIFTKVDDIWGYGRYPVLLDKYLDRWRVQDPNANPYDPSTEWIQGTYPALRSNYSGTTDNLITDKWRLNANYLRIKSVELGYTLPKSLTGKWRMESIRVYVNGFNLYTFTSKELKNLDPEREEGSYTADLTYPLMRSFNFGINLNF